MIINKSFNLGNSRHSSLFILLLAFFFCILVVRLSVEKRGSHIRSSNYSPGSDTLLQVPPEPWFNDSVQTEVFAPVGGRANIECRVTNLGDTAVNMLN